MHLSYKYFTAALLLTAGTVHAQNTPVPSATAPAGSATVSYTTPEMLSTNNDKYNYSRSFVPRVAITDANAVNENSLPLVVTQGGTAYQDGFGRTIFSIVPNFTKSGTTVKSLATVQDTRSVTEDYSYLPYATTGTGFDAAAFSQQEVYYQGQYPGEGISAFSKTKNTSTILTRSSRSFAPGLSQVRQNKGVEVLQLRNTANEVRRWVLDANGSLSSPGYYAAGELGGGYINNAENSASRSFTDRSGRVVYKRVLLATLTSGQNVTDVQGITYYVYDDMGQLRAIIPPKASDLSGSGTVSAQVMENLCFRYDYDKGRLIMQHTPGKGAEYYVYDKRNRPVLYRDSLMKTQGQWAMTFYDSRNRITATGLLTSSQERAALQTLVDAGGSYTTADWQYYLVSYGLDHIYPPDNLTGCTMLSYSYYDDYREADAGGSKWDTYAGVLDLVPLQSITGQEIPKRGYRSHGKTTGSRLRILPAPGADVATTGDWRESAVFYDDKGRVIYTVSYDKYQGNLLHADYNGVQYNFSGQVLQGKHIITNNHSADAALSHTEITENSYDALTGRLTETRHRSDNGAWQVLGRYEYDDQGRVKRNVLGGYAEVQDRNYNIRGQLGGINAVYAETGNKEGESRTFGESLRYDYGFTQPRLDGKLAGMIWRGAGSNAKANAYGYSYDRSGRLTAADFRREATVGPWENGSMDYAVSNLNYDLNGNITSMRQRGMAVIGGISQKVWMDKLGYLYESNSNRLRSVDDTITVDYGTGDFVNGNGYGKTDYAYDANGNLIEDINKGLSARFNHLNKPQEINMGAGRKILNSYDAVGNKVQELVLDGGTSKRRDYVGNFVYENDKVQYAQTAQGRTVYSETENPREEFMVKDHLGNVRSVVDLYTYMVEEYLAGYEIASANLENLLFSRVEEVRDDNPVSPGIEDVKSARLNGGDADRRIGTSLLVHVMAGDKVELNVNSYYDGYNSTDDNPVTAEDMLTGIINTLTGGAGGFEGGEGHNTRLVGQAFSEGNYNSFEAMVRATSDASRPKAYLNYMLFNERMELVSEMSGAFQAEGNGSWTQIGTTAPIEVPENGYLAVYLNNASNVGGCNTCSDVYFDKLVFRMSRGSLKEEAHYYPFGLPMAGVGSAAPGMKENRRKYQDNEYVKELGLNWMDFHARQYDPQIGRFLGVDLLAAAEGQEIYSPYAAMGNAPESLVDPNGESPQTMGVTPWTRATSQMSMGKSKYQGPGGDREQDLEQGMMRFELGARAASEARRQHEEEREAFMETMAGTDFIGNGIADAGCDHSITSVEEGDGGKAGAWRLSFTGEAHDETKDGKTRQMGVGQLAIIDAEGNVVASYDAISGAGINGLLPNGNYKGANFVKYNRDWSEKHFPDETGLEYTIALTPTGDLAKGFNRSGLLIHPTQRTQGLSVNGAKSYNILNTDGCIGLVGNANSAPFLQQMQTYFQSHNFINLNVNIINNANINYQLGNKSHY